MATPTVIPSISDLKSFVGKRLGPSNWVVIEQSRIDAFADATDDHQWIHVDPERAASDSPFGGPIAHGYLTIALAPALLPEVMRVEGVRHVVNYGLEKMRLPTPVPAGARVRLFLEIKNIREISGGAARASLGITFEVEGAAKPACIAEAVYVYYP